MRLEFFMPMKKVPTCTHQEKKVHVVNGKPIFYEPDELRNARNKLSAYLSAYVPQQKLAGALMLNVTWCFPLTTTCPTDGDYKITKPDTDNLNKLLKDCMTVCGYWHDDAQVAVEIIQKYHAQKTGIYIIIEEIKN